MKTRSGPRPPGFVSSAKSIKRRSHTTRASSSFLCSTCHLQLFIIGIAVVAICTFTYYHRFSNDIARQDGFHPSKISMRTGGEKGGKGGREPPSHAQSLLPLTHHISSALDTATLLGASQQATETSPGAVASESTEAVLVPSTRMAVPDSKFKKSDASSSSSSSPSSSSSSSVLEHSKNILSGHPLFTLARTGNLHNMPLEQVLKYLHDQPECQGLPLFISMANVYSDLYWQMIENFVYTMVKFNVSSCSVMVCVSDPNCMNLCRDSGFPCIDFRYKEFHPERVFRGKALLPHVMEQIAELKLFHLPKALGLGVDLLMLDLDVGFTSSPSKLLEQLNHYKRVDVFVQRDISFVMNRTLEGWRTWFTVPMPNIGMFLCRGNERTVRMFNKAWKDYCTITKDIKMNPGKDQNKVVNAMKSTAGLKWHYIPKESAVLLDKIYKFDNKTYELGGEAALSLLNRKGVFAVHSTCYEQKSKVMGLKATNAFWNPEYYNPNRATITKRLIYQSEQQLRSEVRALLYLAIATNRSLIIPNVLGFNANSESYTHMYNGSILWPGFRVAYLKDLKMTKFKVDILEPAFYWRVRRDYCGGEADVDEHESANSQMRSARVLLAEENLSRRDVELRATCTPRPVVLSIGRNEKLASIEKRLLSPDYVRTPRIVLHIASKLEETSATEGDGINITSSLLEKYISWAEHSVGIFDTYEVEERSYGPMPALLYNKRAVLGVLAQRTSGGAAATAATAAAAVVVPSGRDGIDVQRMELAHDLEQESRLCALILHEKPGNRSCFDKCK